MAVIVAGSSIDTTNYGDIDLSLLTGEPLRTGQQIPRRANPEGIFQSG